MAAERVDTDGEHIGGTFRPRGAGPEYVRRSIPRTAAAFRVGQLQLVQPMLTLVRAVLPLEEPINEEANLSDTLIAGPSYRERVNLDVRLKPGPAVASVATARVQQRAER